MELLIKLNSYHQFFVFIYSHLCKHLLLLIFLPALIFESAFGMSWHIFKKEFGKILLLAGPGVIIVAILEAIVFY